MENNNPELNPHCTAATHTHISMLTVNICTQMHVQTDADECDCMKSAATMVFFKNGDFTFFVACKFIEPRKHIWKLVSVLLNQRH